MMLFILLLLCIAVLRCSSRRDLAPEVGPDSPWQMNKIDVAKYPNAVCLDGSPGAFWFSPGSGSGVDKYIFHHMGGGWCNSLEECVQRAHTGSPFQGNHKVTSLGSSTKWAKKANCARLRENDLHRHDKSHPCYSDGGSSGLFSFSQEVNPIMYNWNKIFIGYCDGSSFSSRQAEPVLVDGDGKRHYLHFKGRYILEAIYDIILRDYGMKKASEVVISGSSAGGVSVFVNIDFLSKMIKMVAKTSPTVVGIVDGSYFMDLKDFNGEDTFSPTFKRIYETRNMTVDWDCRANYKDTSESWKCLMPQYALKFVDSPLFIVQSFIDGYQTSHGLHVACLEDNVKCNKEELKYVINLKKSMIQSAQKVLAAHSGFWFTSCEAHTITHHNKVWMDVLVQSQSLKTTLLNWYTKVTEFLKSGKDFKDPGLRVFDKTEFSADIATASRVCHHSHGNHDD